MRRRAEGALLLLALAAAPAARAEVADRIVLRVNGEIATLVEYEQRKRDRVEQIAQSEIDLAERRRLVEEAGRSTMKEIFEELLVLSRARQLHLEVTPAQIDRAVESSRQRFGIETEAEFQQAIAQSGFTPEDFRRRMAKNLLFNQVFEREVQSQIKVDDEAVARYWNEHPEEFLLPEARRIEEIVVREDSLADEAARRALASDLAARAAQLGSLAEAATAAAAGDAVSAVIDHGWVEAGTLAAELEQAAWATPAGGVSQPVAARGGLHVLRVVEIRAAAPRPLDEVRERIHAKLNQERFDERLKVFLAELADEAYVVESLPADAVGYRSSSASAVDPLRELMRGAAASAAAPETAGGPVPEAPAAPAPTAPGAAEPEAQSPPPPSTPPPGRR